MSSVIVIIFIHKPGTEKHDPHNYRPISLLNTMGKIFGKILNTKLNLFLRANNIIKESQHGFRSKRGTSTLIANMYERICREKDDKKTLITLVLRDVSKAFDKVHKDSLIYKLSKLGLPDPLLRVLSNFLQNRTAQVKINDKLGDIFNLSCGVPPRRHSESYIISYNDERLSSANMGQKKKEFCNAIC